MDLNNRNIVKTIGVGVQPVAVILKSDETLTYIANYGSGTVSEINLSTLAIGRTVAVGANPQTLSIDPGGSSLWVAGQGYLKKIDFGTFTVTNTVNIFGTVTSLGASQQQNALIYTVVNDGLSFATQGGTQAGQSSSNYSVREIQLSDMTIPATYGTSTAQPYSTYTMNGTLPNSTLGPGTTQVSSLWANAMVASATPTGFIVYDMVNQTEILEGVTSTPVRGIASDPNNLMIFMTTPDSNSFITMPLPVH